MASSNRSVATTWARRRLGRIGTLSSVRGVGATVLCDEPYTRLAARTLVQLDAVQSIIVSRPLIRSAASTVHGEPPVDVARIVEGNARALDRRDYPHVGIPNQQRVEVHLFGTI